MKRGPKLKFKIIKRNCLYCNKEFECKENNKQKFCSVSCGSKPKRPNRIKREIRQCLYCNKKFGCLIKSYRKFCSSQCGNNYKKGKFKIKREIRICKCGCNQIFICRINSRQRFISRHFLLGQKRAKFSKEHNLKIRLAAIKRIEENYGQCWPNYNKEACEFFKSYDEINNTKGRYAVYGGGEYYINKLGYWVDYINFDLKLIMEYDETHHFDRNGNLKEKDIMRQKQIQELYPDFTFRRIKQSEAQILIDDVSEILGKK